MSQLWEKLVKTYAATTIEVGSLKQVTLAQWALESGFGDSELAREHYNFAGLKYRARINRGREDNPLATPVDYNAHDGIDTYCKFSSLEDFIHGYWAFIDNGSHYDGWKDYADDPGGYISHLYDAGYATDENYVAKVLDVLPRIKAQTIDLGQAEVDSANLSSNPGALPSAKVAVLIGHNERRQGAKSPYLQASEWIYNQRIARFMVQMESEFELELKVFFRYDNPNGYGAEIADAYARIDAWSPAVIVELHFNSFNGNARGCEMLHWHTSTRGKTLAGAVQNAVVTELGLPSRGLKPAKQGDRGATSLRASQSPTILTEPFFGDSQADCQLILSKPGKALARAYMIGIRDAVNQL